MTEKSREPLVLKTFPSGYLGNPNVPQTEAMSDIELRRRLLNPAEQYNPDETRANQDVTQLWAKALGGGFNASKADWSDIEQAIAIVKESFGMTSVRDWAKAQKYSNAFTHLNMQHLIETFNYVVKIGRAHV